MLSWLRAVGSAGATNLGILALTVLNGVIVARMLGPEGRGALFALLAYPTVVAGTIGASVQLALLRRAAAGRGEPSAFLSVLALRAGAVVSVVSLAISGPLVLWAPGLDPAARGAGLAYTALWTPANVALMNLVALDLGQARWRRYNALRFALYPLNLAGLALAAAIGQTRVVHLLAIYLAGTLALLAARLVIGRREGGFGGGGPHGSLAALFREARPYFVPSASTVVAGQLDQVLAAGMLDHRSAGLYAVAQRAGGLTAPLGEAVGQASLAESARSPADPSADPVGDLAPQRLTVAALAGLTLGLAPLVWWLIPVLYGEAFGGARAPALVCLGGSALLALSQAGEQRLEGAGRPELALRSRATGLAGMLAIAAPGGLSFGLWGLVTGSAVAQALRALVLCRTLAAFHRVPIGAVVLASREDLGQAGRLALARFLPRVTR